MHMKNVLWSGMQHSDSIRNTHLLRRILRLIGGSGRPGLVIDRLLGLWWSVGLRLWLRTIGGLLWCTVFGPL